jgi:hypothetical protein
VKLIESLGFDSIKIDHGGFAAVPKLLILSGYRLELSGKPLGLHQEVFPKLRAV